MSGARPSGWNVRRRAFTGGSSSAAETRPVKRRWAVRLAVTRSWWRSTTTAGNGSWRSSSVSSAARTGAMSVASIGVSW